MIEDFYDRHGVCPNMERETGIEPATSTLARLRYTTKPLPHGFAWFFERSLY